MLSLFAALHGLAAPRGEGLRPELLELVERSALPADGGQSANCSEKDQSVSETSEPKSPRWADHLRF
jgi:hypothetical protein